MRTIFRLSLAAVIIGVLISGETPAQLMKRTTTHIQAKRGKRYRFTKQHGPWMIMVASFSEPPPERRTEGMSPQEAADELVYELRKVKRIPAYTYVQDNQFDRLETIDRPSSSGRCLRVVVCGSAGRITDRWSRSRAGERPGSRIEVLQPAPRLAGHQLHRSRPARRTGMTDVRQVVVWPTCRTRRSRFRVMQWFAPRRLITRTAVRR